MKKVNPHHHYPKEIFREIYRWDVENNPGGYLGKVYIRWLSVGMVRVFAALPVTPNHLTASSIVVAFLALIILYHNPPYANIYAAILIQTCLVLGYADGDMVRLKKLGNRLGGWFDGVADMTKINIIYFAIAVGDYVQRQDKGVFFYLSLLIATRLIMAHIMQKTAESFSESTQMNPNEIVAGGYQQKLSKLLHLDPSYLTFSDDFKFLFITIFVLLRQYLLGIYFFVFLHSFLALFAAVNVWRIGKREARGDIGWRK